MTQRLFTSFGDHERKNPLQGSHMIEFGRIRGEEDFIASSSPNWIRPDYNEEIQTKSVDKQQADASQTNFWLGYTQTFHYNQHHKDLF